MNNPDIPTRLTSVPEHLRRHIGIPVLMDSDRRIAPLIEVVDENGTCLRRGNLCFGQGGSSLFCFHLEVPVAGSGEEPEMCFVLEREGSGSTRRTAYLDWCRALDLRVLCPRCRRDVLDPATERCDPIAAYNRRVERGEIDVSDIPLLDDPTTWPERRGSGPYLRDIE